MPTILDIARLQKVINYENHPSIYIKHDIIKILNIESIYRNTILGFEENTIIRPRPC